MPPGIPALRLELQGMSHTLMAAILQHHKEVEAFLEAELKKLIESYDFASEIKRQMTPIMQRSIQSALEQHFLYGEGSKIIEAAVKDMLTPKVSP